MKSKYPRLEKWASRDKICHNLQYLDFRIYASEHEHKESVKLRLLDWAASARQYTFRRICLGHLG